MSINFKQAASRIRSTWNELDYAQRRLLELRTGQPVTKERTKTRNRVVEELESLYALGR